jgi:tRNA pseudouridine38-40 synthase
MAELHRIKMIVAYDGTNYCGWQLQPGQKTIQGEIESALAQLYRIPIRITGAGRTDTGVHAKGMVVHFDLPFEIDSSNLQYRLNALLPEDIRILSVEKVAPDFHARFSATSRKYIYTIINQPNPFLRDTAWFTSWQLDTAKLNIVSSLVLGEKDFSALKIHSGNEGTICNVTESYWEIKVSTYEYHVRSNRFLHGMVRFLVGLQVAYARNAISLNEYQLALIEEHSRYRAFKAPAKGLCLVEVGY